MDEPVKNGILDILGNSHVSVIAKIIIFTSTNNRSDNIEKFLKNFIEKHEFTNDISGILFVYPNYILCLIESVEELLYRVCSELLEKNPKDFSDCRYFPVHCSTIGRFFRDWHSRKVKIHEISSENLSTDINSIKMLYNKIIDNIYQLCWQFKSTNDTQELIEKLDGLSIEGSTLLPSTDDMHLISTSSWGYELQNLVKNYHHSDTKEENIWPIQKIQIPSVINVITKDS